MSTPFKVEITISSLPPVEGTWTKEIIPRENNSDSFCNVSIYGDTWNGTVTLQRKVDELNWRDVEIFTSNEEIDLIDKIIGTSYRIGMKQADYVSGSVIVIIKRS